MGMPRPRRLRFEGAVYHVTGHAVGPEVLFAGDTDRRGYLHLLREVIERAEVSLLAYALMVTHVHLVLCTPRANVSSAVQWLHARYGEAFNRRARRRGHLFGGRFYSTLVDTDAYLLEVTRYAHLNPVRAGLVSRPENYRWSSYRSYMGQKSEVPVDPQRVLKLVGSDRATQVREYRQYVEEPLAVRLSRQRPGTRAWETAALAAVADALGVLRADVVGRRTPGLRAAAAELLVDELMMTPVRVARLLGVHVHSVVRAVRQVRRGSLDPGMGAVVARARNLLRRTLAT
jgi:REP element-mobilizing transposase RayT